MPRPESRTCVCVRTTAQRTASAPGAAGWIAVEAAAPGCLPVHRSQCNRCQSCPTTRLQPNRPLAPPARLRPLARRIPSQSRGRLRRPR
eukprot:scaffold24105_cov113-Isochrysis_galbana.AAC.4